LLGLDRAIVTDVAGTTRDQLHEKLTIAEIPISLIDTAGLRETSDTVESIGVERSHRTMADADLVVVLFDVSEPLTSEDFGILDRVLDLNHLVAFNKIDKITIEQVQRQIADFTARSSESGQIVRISAKTGAGLEDLKASIVTPFKTDETAMSGFLVSDARHYDLLKHAAAEIETSLGLLRDKMSEEIVLIGLHNALRFLGQITGETTTEDMLTRIFATFCIGK
jgi:tRNA modification GTPase